MERLKFWKRKAPGQPQVEPVPTIKRFNIKPRTDIGTLGLPADPDKAARIAALRKRREAVVHDVESAQSAATEDNRWRAEIDLIEQAIREIERDLGEIGQSVAAPGLAVPAIPITDISVETEPVARVTFRIGDRVFRYDEEIDWAERGHQLARSELVREEGDIDALIAEALPSNHDSDIREHLQRSLFSFATDMRDRALQDQATPKATLADLARPSSEFGGWLDWSGQSANQQDQEMTRTRLMAERERLMSERDALHEEQAKTAESLPIARRRLAELDREIGALTADT